MAKEKHYDRVKAIKKAHRADAGPPRKAPAHMDKESRRAQHMSTKDWLAETEEEVKVFRVECLYADETGAVAGNLGTLTVPAADKQAAIAEAMDRRWDPRLEAASCSPRFEVTDLDESDEDDFPWNLHGGDEVYWNDPDGGACSRFINIRRVEFHGVKGDPDCTIKITGTDGDFLECFARELS